MDISSAEITNNIYSYRDLIVWRKGIDLAKQIYALTETFPKQEIYGLTSQLRRAAISVPSNIAEGQARRHSGEFTQFLRIAIGSLAEMDTQLEIAKELGYLDDATLECVAEKIFTIRRMLFGIIRHLPGR